MNKIFFWLAIFGLCRIIWKFVQIGHRKNARRANAAANPAQHRNQSAAGQLPPSETMLRCAHCGVYLPLSDSYPRGELAFCSVEHRDLPRP